MTDADEDIFFEVPSVNHSIYQQGLRLHKKDDFITYNDIRIIVNFQS